MLKVKELTFGEGRPKIIVSLTGVTQEELVKQAEVASHSRADVIEWRVDFYKEALDKEKVRETLTLIHLELNEKPLLFTFRTKDEGGQREIGVTSYKELNELAVASGKVDMLDLELALVSFLGRKFVQEMKTTNILVIISAHHISGTPPDGQLLFQIGVMEQLGADIGKIATTAKSLTDVLRVMALIQKAKGISQLPMSVMAMGDLGVVTRVGAELVGSVFTFASLTQNSAPGQLPLELMSEVIPALIIHSEIEE